MKILAITAAILLLGSISGMVPQVHAQNSSTTFGELQLYAHYTDSTSRLIDGDQLPFRVPATLLLDNKQIDHFRVVLMAFFLTPQSQPQFSVSAPAIRVLAADGTFKTVPTTGADTNPRCRGTSGTTCSIWDVWELNISRATVEGLIGTTTGDYTSNIRAVTGTGAIRVTISGQTLESPSMQVNADFTARGITGGGGSTGDAPTGKHFVTMVFNFKDGTSKTLTNIGVTNFALLDIALATDVDTLLSLVTYKETLYLDRDIYQMPAQVKYANNDISGNWKVTVENQEINKVSNPVVTRQTGASNLGLYTLLSMTVQPADIEAKLPIAASGTLPDGRPYEVRNGDVVFSSREGSLPVTYGGTTYNIKIPATMVTYDVTGTLVFNPDGTCEVAGETTSCNPGGGEGFLAMIAGYFNISEQQAMIVLIGVAVTVIGAGLAVMKGGKKKVPFSKSSKYF